MADGAYHYLFEDTRGRLHTFGIADVLGPNLSDDRRVRDRGFAGVIRCSQSPDDPHACDARVPTVQLGGLGRRPRAP